MDKTFSHLEAFITNLVTEAVQTALQEQQNHLKTLNTEREQKEEVLNADQAAAFLHIAKQTLYTMTSKRKIPFYKHGKKILFRRGDLEDWLNRGKHNEVTHFSKEGQLFTRKNPLKR